MTPLVLLILTLASAAVIVASLVAFDVGFRRGRDAGWCEHHFSSIEKDRARRDRVGRFVAIKGREEAE